MSSNDTQRGYSIDTGRRRRRQIGIGLLAAAAAVIVAVVVIDSSSSSDASDTQFGTNLKIGYMGAFASEQRLLDFVADEVAPDYGLTIEPVELGDPNQIDRAVSEGNLAGTVYEHKHWLAQQTAAAGTQETATEPIFKWAFAIYSDKWKSLDELPDGATIGIPSDPPNQSQALWLLQREGLITIKDGVKPEEALLEDVDQNPHNLNLKPLELGVMPRALGDLDAGISYVDFFDASGTPSSKQILSPVAPDTFAGQLVVGTKFLEEPNIKKLIELWQDPKIQTYLKEEGAPALYPLDAKDEPQA
ncbi:MAG: MetQ/NlpA family ABC transporter substrate-binding protein [Solirubrobacterales bacterium]